MEQIKQRRVWIIPSASYGSPYNYEVTLTDGLFACTCPDFQFRPGHHCKHIRKVKRLIAGEKQKNKLPGVRKKDE